MTEHKTPTDPERPSGAAHDAIGADNTPDETFTWTDPNEVPKADGRPAEAAGGAASSVVSDLTAILGFLREAVEDLADRAAPTVREFAARAAELAAVAADRAAPLVKRAGEVTADASGKLASKSRDWAAELRSSLSSDDPTATPTAAAGNEPPVRPSAAEHGTNDPQAPGGPEKSGPG